MPSVLVAIDWVANRRAGLLEVWKLERCCVSNRKKKTHFGRCRLTIDGMISSALVEAILAIDNTLKAALRVVHDLGRAHAVEFQAVILHAACLCTIICFTDEMRKECEERNARRLQ